MATDYIQAQGSAEARRQNLIEQLGRGECPESVRQAIEDMLAEIAALKRKVLDNIQRHEDVEAQIRRDAGEQVRVLREALSYLLADIEDYQRINNLGGHKNQSQVEARAALASTAPVAEAVKEEGESFEDNDDNWAHDSDMESR